MNPEEEEFSWFIEDLALTGTLISRLRDGSYLIYFPYTKRGIKDIREGRLVAVRNFLSERDRICYSILELVEIQPIHHALGTSPERIKEQFPGFVTEAARSCRQDWEQEEPTEETTVIHAVARPTGIELSGREGNFQMGQDESIPMPGEDVIMLSSSGMERIINWRVESESYKISPCWLATEDQVSINLDARELLETHVGVFGFTGTGKSNLVSTLISQMLSLDWNLRVIIMDYMFEYFPLLSDHFAQLDCAQLLLDFLRIPGGESTINALSYYATEDSYRTASQLLVRSMTKSRGLRREDIIYALENLMFHCLQEGKVKILLREPTGRRISDELRQIMSKYPARWLGAARHAIETWVGRIAMEEILDERRLAHLAEELDGYAAEGTFPIVLPTRIRTYEQRTLNGRILAERRAAEQEQGSIGLSRSAIQCVREMAEHLERLSKIWGKAREIREAGNLYTIEDLVTKINNEEAKEKMLIVFYSESPDNLRATFAEIAQRLYDERRLRGQNEPPVFLVVDEADEFVPGRAAELGPIFESSRAAAETIARRGRKLGLGLCIATQRAGYLDTRMMGQLHTYFISKLPREYDRKVIADAYGIDREIVDQALHFPVGQWLVISHTATGMPGVPIPARFQNAEERVHEALKRLETK